MTSSVRSVIGATGAGVNDLGAAAVDDEFEVVEEEADVRPRETRVSASLLPATVTSSSFFFSFVFDVVVVVVVSSLFPKSSSTSSSLDSFLSGFAFLGLSRERLW